MKNYISFLLFVLLTISCSKDESAISENYFIDDELQPYFDLFVEAGAARGHEIDLSAAKIEGFLAFIAESGVVGQCQFDKNSPHTITIDKRYWKQATTLEKEYLVLHELGHCYLERQHQDERNQDGTCTSIMESGLETCRSDYNLSTKAAYLDELFE